MLACAHLLTCARTLTGRMTKAKSFDLEWQLNKFWLSDTHEVLSSILTKDVPAMRAEALPALSR